MVLERDFLKLLILRINLAEVYLIECRILAMVGLVLFHNYIDLFARKTGFVACS